MSNPTSESDSQSISTSSVKGNDPRRPLHAGMSIWDSVPNLHRQGVPPTIDISAKRPDDDPVNHPRHYTAHPSGVECIEITEHMNFNLGNATKYIWRADDKNGIEDLEKAAWYINREIKRRSP